MWYSRRFKVNHRNCKGQHDRSDCASCRYVHVTFATGQTGGPFTEDAIRSMIARQQIKITDFVVLSGGSTWVPITQSPFARDIVTQASVDRLAASTCPRCGAAMAVVAKGSSMGTD